jgi:hypothetical protein
VGYQVVQVVDEQVPVTAAIPQAIPLKGGGKKPKPVWLPSSAVGYQVVQVAEEKVPGRPRTPVPKARRAKEAPPRKSPSPALWGVLATGVFCLVAFVLVVAAASLSNQSSATPSHEVVAPQGNDEVNIPEVAAVVLPDETRKIGKPVAQVKIPEAAADPVEGKGQGWGAALPAKDDGQACKAGDPPRDRETFGTAVTFARNPVEAAWSAREERKLTFLLHVSGNFEDNQFT